MESAGKVLEAFYTEVRRKDIAAARKYLDPDLTFVGQFETYRNAEQYLAALTDLLQIVVRLDVKAIIARGENAAVFFELETSAPAVATTLVAEWRQIRDGKIVHVRSAFDGRPFEAMFSGSQPSHP
jgi:SnoaL-like protein